MPLPLKIKSLLQLYEQLPEEQRIITDVLRHLAITHLPDYCREKISYNVPFFYGNKGICIIWPAAIPRGGIKQGVLLGFWYGNRLNDVQGYLTHGNNRQIFYKIYHAAEEIKENPLRLLFKEAARTDALWKKAKKQ
jgi:Domain of unknown function (DU1801)